MSLSDDTTMEVMSGLRRQVDVEAASRLRLPDEHHVAVLHASSSARLHLCVPFGVTRVSLPEAVARPVLDAAETPAYRAARHYIIIIGLIASGNPPS